MLADKPSTSTNHASAFLARVHRRHDAWPTRLYGEERKSWLDWLEFIFSYVVTPFGSLAPLCRTGVNSEVPDKDGIWGSWRGPCKIILVLLLLVTIGSQIYGLTLPTPRPSTVGGSVPTPPPSTVGGSVVRASGYYLAIGILFNVFVLPLLYAIFWFIEESRSVEFNTGQLLGHKVWAEDKTHELLKEIVDNERFGRSKWHIVKFLAILADERISGDKEQGFFKLSTHSDGQWHVSKYSRFLSDNIEHAQEEALWLVDPKDFTNTLIPQCLRYVLASLAIIELGGPTTAIWSAKQHYSTVFKPMLDAAVQRGLGSPEDLKTKLEAIRPQPVDIDLSQDDKSTWNAFENVVLAGMSVFGGLLVQTPHSVREDVILAGFQEFYAAWLSRVFPHIAAFRRCGIRDATRIVLVPRGNGEDGTYRDEEAAIQDMANALRESLDTDKVWTSLASPETQRTILATAFRMFEYLSGGAGRIKAYITKGESVPPVGLDIGIYDRKFVVWSKQLSESSRREVTWFYLEDIAKAKFSEDFPEQLPYGIAALRGETADELTYEDKQTSYKRLGDTLLDHVAPAPQASTTEDMGQA